MCGGTCVLVIDYSFALTVPSSPGFFNPPVVSDAVVDGRGPLGSQFGLKGWNSVSDTSGYIPIFDVAGDEIDLFESQRGPSAYWYVCKPSACLNDFALPTTIAVYGNSELYGYVAEFGTYPLTVTQTVTDTPTGTPEAPTALLLGVGGLCLFLYRRRLTHGLDT